MVAFVVGNAKSTMKRHSRVAKTKSTTFDARVTLVRLLFDDFRANPERIPLVVPLSERSVTV